MKNFIKSELYSCVKSLFFTFFWLSVFEHLFNRLSAQIVLDSQIDINNLDTGSMLFGFLVAIRFVSIIYIIGKFSPYRQDCFGCQRIKPYYK